MDGASHPEPVTGGAGHRTGAGNPVRVQARAMGGASIRAMDGQNGLAMDGQSIRVMDARLQKSNGRFRLRNS
jgi:hypothetical protein